MRKLLVSVLGSIALGAMPLAAQETGGADAAPPSTQPSLTALQGRFQRLQQAALPQSPRYELRLAAHDHSLFEQADDGFVRLPEGLVDRAANRDTRDYLMLAALAVARAAPPPRHGHSAARVMADVVGAIGRIAAENTAQRAGAHPLDYLAQRNAEGAADDPATITPALRGLFWSKANGACEARIVAGLRALAADGRGINVISTGVWRGFKRPVPLRTSHNRSSARSHCCLLTPGRLYNSPEPTR